MSLVHDVLILGSGAAGYTAAIYAGRANRKPVLIAGPQPGGQLTITSDVENYPGFRDAILGPELMERMRDQAARFGTEMVNAIVERVDLSRRPFTVWAEGREFRGKTLIVATGAAAKLTGLPSETQLLGMGVSACATCDGFFFKGKRVVVVGGGDTAMEEATYLTRYCSEVVVVHRRHELRASRIMQDRAFSNPKIRFIWDSELVEIIDPTLQKVTGVKLRNLKTGAVSDHPTDGVFIAIGHQPNTQFLAGQLPTDPRGYLLVESGSTRTKIPGVFGAGDVVDAVYRQAVTAAGMGCMAAIDAERFLEHEEHMGADGAIAGAAGSSASAGAAAPEPLEPPTRRA